MNKPLLLIAAVCMSSMSFAQMQIDKRIELTGSGNDAKVEGVQMVVNNFDAANKIYVDTNIANALSGTPSTLDFTITAAQSSITCPKGGTSSSTMLELVYVSGVVSEFVSLSASGLPSGATLTFDGPAAGFPSFNSSFYFSCNSAVVAGTYPIIITATGGVNPKSDTVDLVVLNQYREFITSGNYNGNRGGISGADGTCQSLANGAGLGGTWKAWLSDASTNAKDRFTPGAIVSVTGTVIATSWTDFLDGTNFNMNYDQNGNARTGLPVWSGTNNDGTKHGSTCNNWGSSSSGVYGLRGNTYGSNLWSSDGGATSSCNNAWPFYCIEQ